MCFYFCYPLLLLLVLCAVVTSLVLYFWAVASVFVAPGLDPNYRSTAWKEILGYEDAVNGNNVMLLNVPQSCPSNRHALCPDGGCVSP